MRSEARKTTESVEFPFELVIKRRGFFIMPKASWFMFSNTPDFDRKMRKQGLTHRQVVLNNYYVNGSNIFYRIEYNYGS